MTTRNGSPRRSVVAAALVVLIAPLLQAHHSAVIFDRETPVAISGTVVRFEYSSPHSFLYLAQQTPDGPIEWAVEGPSPFQLERRGMDDKAFVPGDAVEACGYTLIEAATTGAYSGKRVLLAEVMVMPDGAALLWSPYGNERCRTQKGYVVAER